MEQIQTPNTKIHKDDDHDDDDSNTFSSSAAKPPWIDLPADITANILKRLRIIEILESAQKVCTTWRNVCKDPAMWRVIHMECQHQHGPYDIELVCRHAVDRSQGQLVDIDIEYFGTNDLLRYISERSSQLRRLRLMDCDYISGKVLREAVAEFPNIEELHLIFMSSILPGDVKSIGFSCPKLKSFTLHNIWHWHPYIGGNEFAWAVAENMRGLHHLKLFGNRMTNDGLRAILDGCPYLESLDLRQCFNVALEGDLGKRCSEQIKDIREPFEDGDYESDSKTYIAEPYYGSYSEYSDNYSTSSYENDSHPLGSEDLSVDEAIFYPMT